MALFFPLATPMSYICSNKVKCSWAKTHTFPIILRILIFSWKHFQ